MSIKNLNCDNFKVTIETNSKPILVDFYADWCGPCKMMAPVMEEIAAENSDKLDVFKVNIDECPEIAREFSIRSIPTIMSFKDGKAYKSVVGAGPKEDMINLIK